MVLAVGLAMGDFRNESRRPCLLFSPLNPQFHILHGLGHATEQTFPSVLCCVKGNTNTCWKMRFPEGNFSKYPGGQSLSLSSLGSSSRFPGEEPNTWPALCITSPGSANVPGRADQKDRMSGTAQGKPWGAAALPSGAGRCSAPLKGIFVLGFTVL